MKRHSCSILFFQFFFITFILALSLNCLAAERTYSVESTIVNANQPVGNVSRPFLNLWSDITPSIQTIIGKDGTVSVLSTKGADEIDVYEFDAYGQYIRMLSFPKELPLVGAFARDNEGNYYIFYAKNVNEGAFDENNMALVKYSSDAQRLKAFYLRAQTDDERWASGYSGVKVPFGAGTCKIEISNDWIAVYFARRMFASSDGLNHQASYGFVLDRNSFEKLTGKQNRMPSAGHSFNQFILPVEDGFITVDHGDNGPRAFMFSHVSADRSRSVSAFTFKKNAEYQNTFAEMGGIAQTSDGYLFVGTYEKNDDTSDRHNAARNLFVLMMDENLDKISDPIWLTDYTDMDSENAIFPKIVALDDEHILLMWSVCGLNGGRAEVYYTIVDPKGTPLQPIGAISKVRLNGFDPLRYNPVSGRVHWAVEDGIDGILLYTMDPAVATGDTDPARIVSTEASGEKVFGLIECADGFSGLAYCAFYTSDGQMLSADAKVLTTGENTCVFAIPQDAAEAKIFVVDNGHVPRCDSRTVRIT